MSIKGLMVTYPEGTVINKAVHGHLTMYQEWLTLDDNEKLRELYKNYTQYFERSYQSFKMELAQFCADEVRARLGKVLELNHNDIDNFKAVTLQNKEVVLYVEGTPEKLVRMALAFNLGSVLNMRNSDD